MALAKIFKLTDVITPVTMLEARDGIYRVLERLQLSTTAWASGAMVRTWTIGVSAMFAALTEQQAEIAKSGFLEYATGTWLRIKAKYDYNVIPDDATFATGTLRLVNGGGGIYSAAAGDFIARNSFTGKAYRNVASFDLGSNATLDITVIALEAGTASNANTGAITEFVSEPFARVTMSNPGPLIGRDAESPAEIRAKCSEKLGSLSPFGPWDAYAYAARTAVLSTGESAGITRTRATPDGYGNVYVYVATASGEATGTIGDTATQLGAVDEAIQRNAAPLGETAHVVSASPVVVTVAYEMWIKQSGAALSDVKAAVAEALAKFFAGHPIGGIKLDDEVNGHVFAEALTSVIHAAAAPAAIRVALIVPTTDVELTAGQVPTLLHDPNLHATIHVTATVGLLT